MNIYSMDLEDLTKSANVIKESLLFALERDGLLKKPAKEVAEAYVVVLHKRGWLGELFRWVWGEDKSENSLKVSIMKSV